MSIAFKPEQLKTVKKDFRGVVTKAEYMENPKFPGKQLHIEIYTEEYELHQHEWYPPSDKKATKWGYFLEALQKVGALKDVKVEGLTDDDRMLSFGNSIVGMDFHWTEAEYPTMAKRNVEIMLPVEYFGKKDITKLKVETVTAKPPELA